MSWRRIVLAALAPMLLVAAARVETPPVRDARGSTIVLVGGVASEGPGRHAYPLTLRRLADALRTQRDAGGRALQVRLHADGWPGDAGAFDDAATVVWYFDGAAKHPLADPRRRAQAEALHRRGVGIVALHQASTATPTDDFGLAALLGGVRRGLFDRTTETARLVPTPDGVARLGASAAFELRDEFYPSIEFTPAGGRLSPLLRADLHPQFRDGVSVLSDAAETRTVAWAWEPDAGGRAIAYTGLHFDAALDAPSFRDWLLRAIAWSGHLALAPHGATFEPPKAAASAASPPAATPARPEVHPVATFHGDRGRSGWLRDVGAPTAAAVRGDFALAWESLPFVSVDGQPARLYATPLFVPGLEITEGPDRGERLDAVIAATSNGEVVAINARRAGDLAPGRVLWRRNLGAPCRLQPAPLDGVPTGILSTPVADLAAQRLYVTHCDPAKRWQAWALDLGSGAPLPGWPVRLDEETLNAVNANAGPERVPPRRKHDFRVQRGALNLSPDGGLLYVVFGETETGWLVALDTRAPRVASAFASAAMPHRGSGGIWGAGGPAVDADGSVFVVTGSGFDGYKPQDHDWTQSVLKLQAPGAAGGFRLLGTYTPFNHCGSAANDIDLGSGGVTLLPALDVGESATPRLLTLGGKQGNAYLLDRDRLPGDLARRPLCSTDAASDRSLLPPAPQPQFGTRGPVNVFGPYSERDAALDLARARSVPAAFRAADGRLFAFFTGTSKAGEGVATSVPPSLARLEVVRAPGAPAWLRVDGTERRLALANPGSPVVTGEGGDAVLWVLDENAPRSASLAAGRDAPQPVLYAFDPMTLTLLWRSPAGQLATSGKYNAPGFGVGQVFVGTDRIQAYAAGGRAVHVPAAQPAAREPAPAPAPAKPVARSAAALYAQRCAGCHDAAVGNVPPRRVLATYPRARIVQALTTGLMRPHAAGLDAAQIAALAEFLQ
jgi:mono/diheme cytochrome c family protein